MLKAHVATYKSKVAEIEQELKRIQRNLDKQDTISNERSLRLDDIDYIFYSNFPGKGKEIIVRLPDHLQTLADDGEITQDECNARAQLAQNSMKESRDKTQYLSRQKNNLRTAEAALNQLRESPSDQRSSSSPSHQQRKRKNDVETIREKPESLDDFQCEKRSE